MQAGMLLWREENSRLRSLGRHVLQNPGSEAVVRHHHFSVYIGAGDVSVSVHCLLQITCECMHACIIACDHACCLCMHAYSLYAVMHSACMQSYTYPHAAIHGACMYPYMQNISPDTV